MARGFDEADRLGATARDGESELASLLGLVRVATGADLAVAYQADPSGLAQPVEVDPAGEEPLAAFALASTALLTLGADAGPRDARGLRLPSALALRLERAPRRVLLLPAPFAGGELSGVILLWCGEGEPPASLGQRLAKTGGAFARLLAHRHESGARRLLRERFQDLIESLPLGVVLVDGEGEGAFVNAAAADILRLERGDVPAPALSAAMRALRQGCANAEALAELYAGLTQSLDWSGVATWDLGDRQFEVDTRPLLTDDGSGRVWLFNDVTERLAAERAKAEFVSTVSHELRTPLTSIRGALGLVVNGLAGPVPDAARDLLRIAHGNGERLVLLVNDILDMEKIQSGRMEFEPRPLAAAAAVEQALEANRAYGAQYGVVFAWRGQAPIGLAVLADPMRLQQVLANLLSNAAKFSPAGGTVEVELEPLPAAVRFLVRDHGPGIPEAFRPRLFQRFAQAGGTAARKGGTGLGLSIAKAIVERHGGEIGFESPADGGTLFHFTLPRAAAELAEPELMVP